MAAEDDYIVLNPGVGGDVTDATGVDFPVAPCRRKRTRIQLAGEEPEELAPVRNTDPTTADHGVYVRVVPSSVPVPLPTGAATEATLQLVLAQITLVSVQLAELADRTPIPVLNEIPIGVVDGSNKDFATAYVFNPGSLQVFLDGQYQSPGHDYSVSFALNAFKFVVAPISPAVLTVHYMRTP